MIKIIFLLFIGLFAFILFIRFKKRRQPAKLPHLKTIQQAFKNKTSDVQVSGSGEVIKVLPDDLIGDRHQKFLLRVSAAHTVLVTHNIDLAPRVKNLNLGDKVEFCGEYKWNEQGGLIHWTHRDPKGWHSDGWLKHQGNTYQ